MPVRGGSLGTHGVRAPLAPRASSDDALLDACHLAIAKVGLEVIDGSDAGASRVFERERIVIGSHESADFGVRDSAVSRMHCELIPASGRVVIRDLESRNGTSINGIAFKEVAVTGTTVLQLGHTRIRVVVGSDTAIPLFDGARLGQLVGQSPAMRRAFAIIERAAASQATVLIHGEAGTGKQSVAEAIHRLGPRADEPLLAINCGGPRELLDSELFGHEPGAGPAPGIFEAAHRGSVLLEQIGDLPIELQPKLLAVLERREVRRLGAARPIPVDVRVMAATDRNLAAEINGHRFRSDLYYRLAGVPIVLPPLRARLDDLPLLVADLATRLAMTDDDRARLTTPAMLGDLAAHHWPGNVRELRDYLETCAALNTPAVIASLAARPASPITVDTARPLTEARAEWMSAFERTYATELLRQHHGNVLAAAGAAGTDRLTFYRLLWRLGIR